MIDAHTYCLRRSRWLRLRPEDSRWLVQIALRQLPADRRRSQELLSRQMTNRLNDAVQGHYGNPLVAWFLINVIVPIVVRLVIAWWLESTEV